MAVKEWKIGSKCRFGREHIWTTALAAALNSNEGAELPAEPEWVFWCSACGTVGPWSVDEERADCGSEGDAVRRQLADELVSVTEQLRECEAQLDTARTVISMRGQALREILNEADLCSASLIDALGAPKPARATPEGAVGAVAEISLGRIRALVPEELLS